MALSFDRERTGSTTPTGQVWRDRRRPAGVAGGRQLRLEQVQEPCVAAGSTPNRRGGPSRSTSTHAAGDEGITGGTGPRLGHRRVAGLYFFVTMSQARSGRWTASRTKRAGGRHARLITTFGEDEPRDVPGEYVDSTGRPCSVTADAAVASLRRLQGSDRYATANRRCRRGLSSGATTAVVATGEQFPTPFPPRRLPGRRRAALADASNRLESRLLSTLAGLGVTDVYVVGGTPAVSAA